MSPKPEHDLALAVMEHELLAISPMALTELDHLVHRSVGFPAAMQVMTALTARIAITPLTAGIDAFRILPADT